MEDAWGHGVTTEFVPIRYNWGNIGPILDGMRAAVANGTAAGIDMSAYDLARMDWGGGPPNTEHMSGSDAAIIADALAKSLAPTVQALAGGGSPDPSPQPEPEPEPEPVPTAPASGEESPDPEQREAGTGPDRLVLKISQDAYQGSAEYTVSVDGEQIGGTFTASASNSAGESDTLTLKGDWDAGRHEVAVTFLNDKWDGTPDTDRNLYVDGIIPSASSGDRFCPGAPCDGGEALGRVHQPVPSVAARLHDGLVAVPDAVAQEVGAQVGPDLLDRVRLRGVGRQPEKGGVILAQGAE